MSRRVIKTSRPTAFRRLLAFVAVGSAVWLAGQAAVRLAPKAVIAPPLVLQPPRSSAGADLLLARERLRVRERLLRDTQRRLNDLRLRYEQVTENVLARAAESAQLAATAGDQALPTVDPQVETLAGLVRQREQMLETMTPAHPAVQKIERQIAHFDANQSGTKTAKVSPKIARPSARSVITTSERAEFDRLRTEIALAERNVELNDTDHRAALVEVARLEAQGQVAESPAAERSLLPEWLSVALRAPRQSELVVLASIGSGCLAAWLMVKRAQVTWYVDSAHLRHERTVHAAHAGVPKPHLRPLLVGRVRALVRPRRRDA